jgi:formylmethanofuran dehydrogenase subunit E
VGREYNSINKKGVYMRGYPKFYDKVEKIELYDPLAETLGSLKKGLVKVNYLSIVKFAGHSCPTVAGAYLMSLKGLEALYGDELPLRGGIKVEFKESLEDGVAGVIANVISNITGATDVSGFKGLNGKFARNNLMFFGADIDSNVRFTRVDNGKSVDVYYDPSSIPASSDMQPLMQKVLTGQADEKEKKEFGKLWQKRVKKILLKYDEYPSVIKVVEN